MDCLWLLCVLCLVPVARAVVGGAPASPPEPDAAVVFVQKHGRSARLEGLKNNTLGYYSFYGIRYAEPPLGSRRFQRPVRRLLSGEMSASKPCLPCPQRDPRSSNGIIGQEDCLCLNVFAPKMPGDEKGCPVIFFIHGGNYRSGSTTAYGGQHFTQKDTIIVAAQYRLGSLGYLSTGQKDVNGNLGLFDLHSAMVWINDYIEFFGGDRSRVVLMGHGSGGSAASLLALSPEGRSATGVAALSGTPLSPGAVRSDPKQHASALANQTGCPTEPAERLVLCLRQMPVEKVVMADENIKMDGMDTVVFLDEISGRSGPGARVEGADDLRGLPPIVVEKPAESLNRNEKRCPMLTGVTSAETAKVVFGKYNKFLSGQLQDVKDFIQKDLLGGLQSVVSQVEGLIPGVDVVNQVLPLSNYYQALFAASASTIDGLSEIVEATGDALFNFPAFATVKSWSNGGEAFLYSFEHVGNLSKGSFFLPGLALAEDGDVPQNSKVKGPAHGDELAYLFEPLDSEGKSVAEERMSSTDERARDNFVGLIAKFAHGASKTDANNRGGKGLFDLPQLLPFSKSSEHDQFLKITDTTTVEKDFRFCQMGIWGNIGDRLGQALCKNLITDLLSSLANPKIVSEVLNPLGANNGGQTIPLVGGLPLGANNGGQMNALAGGLPLGANNGGQMNPLAGGLPLGANNGGQMNPLAGGLFGKPAQSGKPTTQKMPSRPQKPSLFGLGLRRSAGGGTSLAKPTTRFPTDF